MTLAKHSTPSYYDIVSDKLKATGINPYVINWIITFLNHRKQRVILYGITEFIDINRGIPQATVLDPTIFSLVVNMTYNLLTLEINPVVKFADGITISKDGTNVTTDEVNGMKHWVASIRTRLNLSKTPEMLVHGKTTKPDPQLLVPDIESTVRAGRLLGRTRQENPGC